jgi:diguanylate cyclase (GGDEF)-like protein
MADLLETLRNNEEIAQKFFEIEVSILSILNFRDLFERLLTEIRDKFGVPYVWISMIDKSEVSDLIQTLESSAVLKERLNVVDRKTFLNLIEDKTKPVLINENLKPYYQLLPPGQMYFMRSLAVAPLNLDGKIIGSLNQADLSRLRYRPGMDTRLLEQLAVKVSICLSNVTAHEKLRWLAWRDPLTGLVNRRVMETVLNREYKRALRYKSPLTLVFIDLDDFKTVNDRYGHERGDEILSAVAGNLTAMTRDSDVVARYAGDEFVAILPGTTPQEALRLIERIQNYFQRNPLDFDGDSYLVSISYGVSSVKDSESDDPATLLRKADEALYRAKILRKKKQKEVPDGLPLFGSSDQTSQDS